MSKTFVVLVTTIIVLFVAGWIAAEVYVNGLDSIISIR